MIGIPDFFVQSNANVVLAQSPTTASVAPAAAPIGSLVMQGIDKPTVWRVLDTNGPIQEKSYTGNATIITPSDGNVSATYVGTLVTHPRSDGMTFSEGKAVITSEEGEIVTHLSYGMGGYDFETNTVNNLGSSFYSSNSNGTLSFMNNMVGVWADVVDPITGIAHANTWKLE